MRLVTNLGGMPKNQPNTACPSLFELEAPHFQWLRGLLSVCEVTGSDPTRAIQSNQEGGDERIHCTLVWWLVTGLHQCPLRVARWLDASPRDIARTLERMPTLVKADPAVNDWAQRLRLQSPPHVHRAADLSQPKETARMDLKDHHRNMGMAALWMTVETGMRPLQLWGTEMGTKEAAKWATLWWLFAGKGLTHDELCTALGIQPREALRLLTRLTQLAAMRPDVFDWMASVRNTTRAAATT